MFVSPEKQEKDGFLIGCFASPSILVKRKEPAKKNMLSAGIPPFRQKHFNPVLKQAMIHGDFEAHKRQQIATSKT